MRGKIYLVIPFATNKFIFELRESCRKSTIASGIVLINTMPLAIVDLRRFDALKCEFICREWYKLAWRSLWLGLAYLETRVRPSDDLISSALAFFAGVRFSQLAENQFVIPSRIEYRESGEEPNPSVICSIQVGNDVTVYESRP